MELTCTQLGCGLPSEVVNEFSMYGVNGAGQDVEVFLERRRCVAAHVLVVEVLETAAPWVVLQVEAQEKADREARHREWEA